MYLIRSPCFKIRIQHQHEFQEAHEHIKIEQCLPEPPRGQEKNKEIKDFLKFNKNDQKTYPDLWDTMKVVLRGKFIALKAMPT